MAQSSQQLDADRNTARRLKLRKEFAGVCGRLHFFLVQNPKTVAPG
jgi:hypothetical protein